MFILLKGRMSWSMFTNLVSIDSQCFSPEKFENFQSNDFCNCRFRHPKKNAEGTTGL